MLYPNNIIYQEVGRSIYYSSHLECKRALDEFRNFVKENDILDCHSKYINIYKKENKWYFEYLKDGMTIFYRVLGYDAKSNAENIIHSIYKKIDCELKDY